MFCQKCGNKLPVTANFCNSCGYRTNTEKTTLEIKTEIITLLPASSNKRLANFIIDRIGCFLFGVLFVLIFSDFSSNFGMWILVVIFFGGYHIFFEGIWQRTPGKWITKTKVVRLDGKKPKFIQILGRSFSRFIPFEPLSFLSENTPIGWHDKFSHTLVVSKYYTEEDVRNIDFIEAKQRKSKNWVMVIVITLVVIVIIGILSSIVLASLTSARAKGQDASIKAQLSSLRNDAETYWASKSINDKDGDYAGLCNNEDILKKVDLIPKINSSNPICNDNKSGYTISTLLNSGKYYCIDSTGEALEVNSTLQDQEIKCQQ